MDVPITAELVAAGLGLDYHGLRLSRTTEAWLAAGAGLRDQVADSLAGQPVQVEVIGSASVLGLLAKPIVDLAVGIVAAPGNANNAGPGDINSDDGARPPAAVLAALVADGWIYRGDAGNDGGHVFVLESGPWHRVAHLHLVERGGEQWRNYLRLRDLLRASPQARDRYQAIKLRLAEQQWGWAEYTAGKTDVVTALLADSTDRAGTDRAGTD